MSVFFKVSIHLYSTCLRLKAIQKKLKVATFLCFTYWVCVGFIHLHVWWEIVSLFGYIFFFWAFYLIVLKPHFFLSITILEFLKSAFRKSYIPGLTYIVLEIEGFFFLFLKKDCSLYIFSWCGWKNVFKLTRFSTCTISP